MLKVFFAFIMGTATFASIGASAADWKVSGAMSIKGEEMITFYDAETVQYSSPDYIRVWVQAVRKADFKKKLESNQKQIIDQSAKKLVNGYFPPYCVVNQKTKFDDCIDYIMGEELVNSLEFKPRAKFFYEINCKDKMIRAVAIDVFNKNGGVQSSASPTDWMVIRPESNGQILQKVLCK